MTVALQVLISGLAAGGVYASLHDSWIGATRGRVSP